MALSAELDDSGSSLARNRPAEASAPHPGWDAALVAAAHGARTRRLTAVVGEPGTGKSLLLARLHAELEASGLSAALVRNARSDQVSAVDVLLLDDADRLSLEELRTLCAQAPGCVVAGRPELAASLAGLEPAIVRLPTMSAEQVGGFFRAVVLRDCGPDAEVDDDAAAAMVEHSGGVPRAVTILAGLAAFAAGLEDAERILARHVEAAVRLRSGNEEDASEVASLRSEPRAPPPFSIFDRPAGAVAPEPSQAVRAAPFPARRDGRVFAACVLAAAAVAFAYVRPGFIAEPDSPAAPVQMARAAVPTIPHVAEWLVAPLEPARATASPVERAAEPQPEAPAVAVQRQAQAEPDPPPAAAPARAPALAALPLLAAYHVVVTYPGHDKAAELKGRAFAALLASHGVVVDPPRPRSEAAERGVFFYFAEDADPARAVADDLDSTARPARRVAARSAREQPLPGTIEVALPLRP